MDLLYIIVVGYIAFRMNWKAMSPIETLVVSLLMIVGYFVVDGIFSTPPHPSDTLSDDGHGRR